MSGHINPLITPFYADQVGSLLRSEKLKAARLQKQNNDITTEQLIQIQRQETRLHVEQQKLAGLTAITDGEYSRAWWHFDFLEGLNGVEGYTPEVPLNFKGTKPKTHSIRITDKISFNPNHPFLGDFEFLSSLLDPTQHVAKQTIPSPNMLFLRGKNVAECYQDNEGKFISDLVQTYQDAIQAFYDKGCRYLQLDDTSWATFFSEEGVSGLKELGYSTEKLLAIFEYLLNESIKNKPEDMLITMHICRGNFRSTYFGSGGYEAAAETIFGRLKVDGLFLEYDDERSGGFDPLKYVTRSDLFIVLGLITSKSPELEPKEYIKSRIQEATKYIPLEQLRLSPQCGFASTEEGNILTEQEQWNKLKHVVEIAEEVWG
ncbi:5-methyltetrahydropteroyltriglutamate--homocysteine S-methyltransferase [Vibrio diazotrophicus]|uniref:5-methyltetrahydropteroyltriglutamate-- homocysteine S-methyltransferase n=1 Tax=Vibrio diazotrophicus TaxID=685 RepID=UPI000C9DAF53|nr:5-methyltetrahydropteroyltriglutamate--homocysteine S-methyltransferase [Vibrio diazotrophicus]PNH93339.1 5-methyltetrahydropteroyltriglutamate--homocysteine methyltransferase [Vibrio diazotrophicus]